MSRSRKRRPRLRFDTLETRALMTVELVNGVVEITGTNQADHYESFEANGKLTVLEGIAPFQATHEFDVASVSRIVADLRGGNDTLACDDTVQVPVQAGGGGGVDNIRGGSADDVLGGNDQSDVLEGGPGHDTLTGGGGGDRLIGGDDDDTLDGGDNNDTIFGGSGYDTILGGGGIDRIHGDDGDDWIDGQTSADFLWGDQGFDYIFGGEDDNDRLWGGTEDDTLDGGSGNDTLVGETGMDVLIGQEGNDSLDGGAGRDDLDAGLNRDTLTGGGDDDTLAGGDGPDLLFGDGAGAANPGDDIVWGGAGNDRVNGDAGNDQLFGEAGNDTLNGGAGDDEVRGDAGKDRARGGAGNDEIYGGDNSDVLLGEDGDDLLYPEAGQDVVNGGKHNDVIVSIDDDTVDTLTGGAGDNDSFWIDPADKVKDASNNERETNVHAVDSFKNSDADTSLNGDGLADPTGGESSTLFDTRPLFGANGPAFTDIDQGDLADCWLLASLASAVNVTPNVARQLVVDLGDGTYAVHFMDQVLNTHRYYRLDADLPVTLADPTTPQFAGLGADGSLWVALVEKAAAMDRGNDYQQLNNDTPYFPLGQLGGTNRRLYRIQDGDKALGEIAANGWASVFCSRLNAADVDHVVPSHCYGIIAILIGLQGQPTGVVLYNPYGVDDELLYDAAGNPVLDAKGKHLRGTMDGTDDGRITLTMAQFAHDAQDPIGVITANYNHYL
jgi:Ca2+-binding RTX toxin-like protein